MICLTALLAVVLVFYAWPIVRGLFVGPSGDPRPITPRGELMDFEKTTRSIFKSASPSVVFITTETRRLNPYSRRAMDVPVGSGSGFIWDEDGHVITNFHVINGATSAHVILNDQTSYNATVVGFSPNHDLAVLKIKPPLGVKLVPIPVGTSHDLEVGQSAFAIGNPFGLSQTLTTGIISALNRTIAGESGRPIEDVIQTDAAINPGNSGGPLLDSAGRLIGVNTAIYSPSGAWSGIGFAIPVDTANRVIPQIIKTGQYKSGKIGIRFNDPASKQLLAARRVQGLAIDGVLPGSPAEAAGLVGYSQGPDGMTQLGDVIIAINDKPVKNGNDVYTAMDHIRPGERLTLTLWNDGQTRKVELVAGE
jgi:S1-C subfamily serine protease